MDDAGEQGESWETKARHPAWGAELQGANVGGGTQTRKEVKSEKKRFALGGQEGPGGSCQSKGARQ